MSEEIRESNDLEETGEDAGNPLRWIPDSPPEAQTLFVETGRGQTASVAVGAPFQTTIEEVADRAHYGGYFRVFLNGEEVINPEEAPETIQAGMRIAISSYDKVAVA